MVQYRRTLNAKVELMIYPLLRKALFHLDAETAHEYTATLLQTAMRTPGALAMLARVYAPATRGLGQTILGMHFAHPIGLAAGFDKHGALTAGMAALGFSHVEVGTVTPLPQAGNPKPRLFRLPEDQALINRMGFNSDGMHAVAARLAQRPRHLPVGINIGKNRDTALSDASSDYVKCMQVLAEHADYVAVNISSPNTPGLRQLHDTNALRELLQVIRAHNQWQRPIMLKISPDESADQLEQVVGTALDVGIDGIIATNTTITRTGLRSALQNETGGLSGAPVQTLAIATLRHVAQLTRGRVPIIGVGGIQSAQDAYERLRAGANLIQLYTALVYVGPAVASRISWGLAAIMRREGIHDIRDIIGIDVPRA